MRTLLIGYKGYWGKNLLRNIQNCSTAELTALVDPTGSIHDFDGRSFQSLSEALKIFDGGLDAAVIVTPSETHCELAVTCLSAGLDVLIEKPMVLDSSEVSSISKVMGSNKVGIDHTFLFDSRVRVMKEVIKSGRIGDILSVQSTRANLGLFNNNGVVWDLAPHDIALIHYLLDDFLDIETVVPMSHIKSDVVDMATIHGHMIRSGIGYTLNLSWLYPKKVRDFTLIGTEGMLEYDMLSDEPLIIYDKVVKCHHDTWEHKYSWKSIYDGPGSEPLALLVSEFSDWVDNRTNNFISDFQSGADVVSVVESINSKI